VADPPLPGLVLEESLGRLLIASQLVRPDPSSAEGALSSLDGRL
jgi:hypothetical protein